MAGVLLFTLGACAHVYKYLSTYILVIVKSFRAYHPARQV